MSIRKPSPSMVVACVALLLATTGTATAARKLFTGADILNRSLTRLDIAKATLTGENVKPGTLLPKHFKGGLPKGPQGPQGAQGPQGPKGDQGEIGLQGAPGLTGLELVSVIGPTNNSDSRVTEVDCPPGKRVVGGGAYVGGPGYTQVALARSWPFGQGWRAEANEHAATASNWNLNAYALCANVTS